MIDDSINGIKIYVSRPSASHVKRSWKERLFSFPWRPWRGLKLVVTPAPVDTNQCIKIGNAFHCGESFYEKLKIAAKNKKESRP